MPESAGRSGAHSRGRSGGRSRRHRRSRMRTVDETSAGGLVVNRARTHVVLIGRLDRSGNMLWSMPKGHIEHGESQEQTAVREVLEETGIVACVLEHLGTIDYWFVAEGNRVHKTVHHFLLEATGGALSSADDEITEAAWFPFTGLTEVLAYADERKLTTKAQKALAARE